MFELVVLMLILIISVIHFVFDVIVYRKQAETDDAREYGAGGIQSRAGGRGKTRTP